MTTYTVKGGDTIEIIAMDLFGTLDAVPYVVAINNLKCEYGGSGVRAAWTCQLTPGQQLKVDVAEVVKSKYPWPWIGAAAALLIGAGIYFRKDIAAFFAFRKILNK